MVPGFIADVGEGFGEPHELFRLVGSA